MASDGVSDVIPVDGKEAILTTAVDDHDNTLKTITMDGAGTPKRKLPTVY